MSQIIYFTDAAEGVRHATFVHAGGHILLRDVPLDQVELLKDSVRDWRNTIQDIENLSAAEVLAFFASQGFSELTGFNPPLVAWSFTPAEAVDPDSVASMTVPQLRALAAELGLEDTGELKKAELVAAIQAKIAGPAPEGEGE